MTTADYPYNTTGPDMDPPIPNKQVQRPSSVGDMRRGTRLLTPTSIRKRSPCRFDASKVVPGSAGGFFNGSTGHATSEDQLAAFIYHNGPTTIGIDADVFGMRAPGCEARGDCFITEAMCKKAGNAVDHSIVLVGYGSDAALGD